MTYGTVSFPDLPKPRRRLDRSRNGPGTRQGDPAPSHFLLGSASFWPTPKRKPSPRPASSTDSRPLMDLPVHDTDFCDVQIVSTSPPRSIVVLTMRRVMDCTIGRPDRHGFRAGNVQQPRRRANHRSMRTVTAVVPTGQIAQLILVQPVGAIEISTHLELSRRMDIRRRGYRSPLGLPPPRGGRNAA